MTTPFRQLLPKSRSNTDLMRLESHLNQPIPKRRNISMACEACRKKKTKCNGNQPCLACTRRSTACIYDPQRETPMEIRGYEGSANDVLGKLRTLPYDEAVDFLRDIRGGVDSSAGVEGDDSMRASPPLREQLVLRGWLPCTPDYLEFELAVRHTAAYPTFLSIDAAGLLAEGIIEPTRMQLPLISTLSEQWRTNLSNSNSEPEDRTTKYGDAVFYSKEDEDKNTRSRSNSIASLRLSRLRINDWTDVSISDDLAAQIISLYLEIDYPVLPLFNAELFLGDLINHGSNFCSRFLVSCLMAFSCQAYITIVPAAESLSLSFWAEATERLEKEVPLNTLTCVSALQLLCMSAVTYGRDDLALQYLQQGVEIGKLMGLFGVEKGAQSAQTWLDGYVDWRRAASYTAWGVFNWTAFVEPNIIHPRSQADHVGRSSFGLQYQRVEIEIHPLLVRPGEEESGTYTDNAEYSDATAISLDAFNASCKLWTIFTPVLMTFYGRDATHRVDSRGRLAYAEGIYRQLLDWADHLPLHLIRVPQSRHATIMMHVYFHVIVMYLFQPHLDTDDKTLRLPTFTARQASPRAAYHASVAQLKRLVLLYRLNYKKASISFLWHTGLIYLANAMVYEASLDTTEWRLYLHLCLAGLEDLHRSFCCCGPIIKGLLGMALQHGTISLKEADQITKGLRRLGKLHAGIEKTFKGRTVVKWIVDLDLALKNPEAAQGGHLAERFEELMLNEEFGTLTP